MSGRAITSMELRTIAASLQRQRAAMPKCSKAPAGWQCLAPEGHGGPCPAAPLTGEGACPDIARCLKDGCQAKCGPGDENAPWAIFGFAPMRWLVYFGVFWLWLLAVIFGAIPKTIRGEWRKFAWEIHDTELYWTERDASADVPRKSLREAEFE